MIKGLNKHIQSLLKNSKKEALKLIYKIIKDMHEIKSKIKDLKKTNYETGLLHYYNNNMFDAKMRFRILNAFYPNDPIIMCNLGRCYIKDNKFQKAFELISKASELDSSNTIIQHYLQKLEDPSAITAIPQQITQEAREYQTRTCIEHDDVRINLSKNLKKIITKHLQKDDKLHILDIGCGSGWVGTTFHKISASHTIHGIDISQSAVQHCKELQDQDAHIYQQTALVDNLNNITNTAFRKYDVIILCNTIGNQNNLLQPLQQLKKLLKKGGTIILSLVKSHDQDVNIEFINDKFSYTNHAVEQWIKDSNMHIVECSDYKIPFRANETYYVIRHEEDILRGTEDTSEPISTNKPTQSKTGIISKLKNKLKNNNKEQV